MKKYHLLFLAGLTSLSFAACSSDDGPESPNGGDNQDKEFFAASLSVRHGDNSRINMVSTPAKASSRATTDDIKNWQRLTYNGIINSEVDKAKAWSATSAIVNGGKLYVTWHSNKQASTEATAWGGAVEAYTLSGMTHDFTATSDRFKFNHAAISGTDLYLAATDAKSEGSIVKLSTSDLSSASTIELSDKFSGFPASVNAVLPVGSKVYAISGYHYGALGSVSSFPNKWHQNQTDKNNYVEMVHNIAQEYGGKYLSTDESGNIWALYNAKDAKLVNLATSKEINLGYELLSDEKYAEKYDYETNTWVVEGTSASKYYGKHTFCVNGNYAYVGCGQNGFRVYDITTGAEVWHNNTHTTAALYYNGLIYTAGGAGLRIYQPTTDSTGAVDMKVYAYQVDNYDSNGNPTTSDAAKEGSGLGHSANFVAVDGTTVYVAYGQDGVKIFNLNTAE